jgi:hypothetical protein
MAKTNEGQQEAERVESLVEDAESQGLPSRSPKRSSTMRFRQASLPKSSRRSSGKRPRLRRRTENWPLVNTTERHGRGS